MDAAVEATALSVNQRKSLAVLGLNEDLQSVGERPNYDPGLAVSLRRRLDDQIQPLLQESNVTQQDPLVVSKYALATVFACEGHYLASRDDVFEWSIAKARGTVLHKVQQASITTKGMSLPAVTAAEQAIERLMQDPDGSLSAWLQERSPLEIAELTTDVTELLNKIRVDIPPIRPQWKPDPSRGSEWSYATDDAYFSARSTLLLGRHAGAKPELSSSTTSPGGQDTNTLTKCASTRS